MRINIINISPEYSAIWKVAYNLFLELKKDKKDSVKFIDLWKTKRVSHNNILRGLQLLFGLNIKSTKNDINFYSTPLLTKTMLKSKPKMNIMFIHDLHPILYLNNSVSWLCKILYPKSKKADLLICNSDSTKKEYTKEYDCSNKIFTNHLGLNNIYFKNKLIKKNKKLTFISIGRDEPRKNLRFMLHILASLDMSFELYRVGGFSNSNLKFVKNNNLANKIKLFKNISEEKLIELYSKSHILLFPSMYEGFGMPALEAMTCGCIPLVANKTSLPGVVGNKELIIKLNVDLWVKKINKIYNNQNYKKKLIKFGLAYSKKFTWKAHKERFIKLVNTCLK